MQEYHLVVVDMMGGLLFIRIMILMLINEDRKIEFRRVFIFEFTQTHAHTQSKIKFPL
jgi:hypothetical protein